METCKRVNVKKITCKIMDALTCKHTSTRQAGALDGTNVSAS